MAYACTCMRTIGMQTAHKTTGTDSSIYLGMSASHSPAIGDKPIVLLAIAEQCDFGCSLMIFGRGLKFLRARLDVTIPRASPVVKPFQRPCDVPLY